MNRKNLFLEIEAIIADQLKVRREKVTPEASLVDDLGADSADLIIVIEELEEKYDLSIPEKDVKNLNAISDIVEYILSHKKP